MDSALAVLKASIGGDIDTVFLVGNVEGRRGIKLDGMSYPQALKSTLQAGLGYAFSIKYHDIGANNPGVAVRAWRDQTRNRPHLSISAHGTWQLGAKVAPSAAMVKVRGSNLVDGSGAAFRKVRMTRPPAWGVESCTMNAATDITTFVMSTF